MAREVLTQPGRGGDCPHSAVRARPGPLRDEPMQIDRHLAPRDATERHLVRQGALQSRVTCLQARRDSSTPPIRRGKPDGSRGCAEGRRTGRGDTARTGFEGPDRTLALVLGEGVGHQLRAAVLVAVREFDGGAELILGLHGAGHARRVLCEALGTGAGQPLDRRTAGVGRQRAPGAGTGPVRAEGRQLVLTLAGLTGASLPPRRRLALAVPLSPGGFTAKRSPDAERSRRRGTKGPVCLIGLTCVTGMKDLNRPMPGFFGRPGRGPSPQERRLTREPCVPPGRGGRGVSAGRGEGCACGGEDLFGER